MYQDKTLTCRECGAAFIFSASEQEFYAEKGFQNEPARCPQCRAARKAASGSARPTREVHPAVCSACGANTMVPFKPSGDKPVYCSDCFRKIRAY